MSTTTANSSMMNATRLYDDPIVIYCKRWSLFDVESGIRPAPMHPIVSALSRRDVVWLIPSPWLAEDRWAADTYRYTLGAIKATAPRHRVIFIANTSAEHFHFRALGLESFVANQNQFVDPDLFTPVAPVEGRRFDAVYNARFRSYKRHHLAARVTRLALIGYSFDSPDFLRIQELLGKPYLGNLVAGELRLLSETEVNSVLNQAVCGLCLSKIEGAMTATVEYLLAGLPVVATTSRGGRDVFLDGRFTRWVEASDIAVKREVEAFRDEQIAPEFIRSETLRKIDLANKVFLSDLASRIAVPLDRLAMAFSSRFNHRLATLKSVHSLLGSDAT